MAIAKNEPHVRAQSLMVVSAFFGWLIFCHVLALSLIVPFLVAFFGIHLFYFRKVGVRLFFNLIILLVLLVIAATAFKSPSHPVYFYLPVASVSMLTMLLFNDVHIGFMMALISSVLASLVLKLGLSEMLVFFLGSLVGLYKVRGARTRGVLIQAGIFISLVEVIAFLLANPVINQDVFFYAIKPLALNGLIGAFVAMATCKIFEIAFGETTNFSLLELSDSAHPLMKRLILEAPGSYHHSLIVSNLAEAAADAIDAHGLLVRVGAYYHDIGKMVHPEYFTENQMQIDNKHDEIGPSISRLIILNHIKEGMELARQYHLNKRIIDFIPEHHGTSIMHYFYQKALSKDHPDGLDEKDYRYPGPRPQSKETAIVLLADSVEAATRTLDEHTPQRIEDLVRKVINNKFIDGQLDECNLTLREIDTIASVFVRVLSAMHHARVKYPEMTNGNTFKKSSKEDTNSSLKNPQSGEGSVS
ncbi:MAG: HDIG domain-containing protein [Candidatus Omnitrophica bacterium]|nr:HDIG domain-containing protein [Candidatus Omnitrophota bacterium]